MSCLLCKSVKADCFSSCDKCGIGLCNSCEKIYCEKRSKLNTQLIKDCSLCKTNFYDFCDFCHDQTLTYIIEDYIRKLYAVCECEMCVLDDDDYFIRCENCEKKFKTIKEQVNILRKSTYSREKKLDDLPDQIKIIIGEPNDYLKEKFNYCDCENHSHCYIQACKQTKQELGILEFELYERGLDYLYCKPCFISELGYNPITQVI